MKKLSILICLSVFLLAFFVSSCDQSPRTVKIGVSQCSGDAWHQTMNQGIMGEALLHQNVSVEILDANYNSDKQISHIKYLLDKGVDALIVAPNEAQKLTPIIEEAFDTGIPVILVDSKINSDKYTTFVGADNVEIGAIAGHYIASRLQNGGEVAVIEGIEGSTSTIERNHGLDSILSNYPTIRIIARMHGDWQSDLVYKNFGQLLQEHPDIDVVFAQNDYMAIAANQVADLVVPNNHIAFVGVDALNVDGQGIDAILERKINASIIYEAGGDVVLKTAISLVEGDTLVGKRIILPTNIVRGYNNAVIMRSQHRHIEEMNNKIGQLSNTLQLFSKRAESQETLLIFSFVIVLLLLGVLFLVVRLFYVRGRANKILKLQKERERHLAEQLKDATNAKISFFTHVSHDLRTPLALISGPISQLVKSNNLDEEEKGLLTVAQNNTFVLLGLINQILDFRKIEEGKFALQVSRVDIKDHFLLWGDAFKLIAPSKNMNFNVVVRQGNYLMNADVQKIESIVYNLLGNAFKFTPPGGSVKVELMEMSLPERTLRIAISDTGLGISKNEIDKIFEPFFQAKERSGGSGIGLSVVNMLVKTLKGTIRVNSEEGVGSTFIIELPMDVLPLSEKVEEETDISKMLNDATLKGTLVDAVQSGISKTHENIIDESKPIVLVVEDNNELRDFIKMQLSDLFSIIEADNGKEGLAMAEKHMPDVVVSDIMMPVMNGMEMCKALKEKLQTSHIPVLMLTAYALDQYQIDAYNYGADAYLSKPFSTELLIARIQNLIESRVKLHDLFKSTTVGAIVDESELKQIGNNVDKSFIVRLNDIIVKRMGESDLNVEDLGHELGLSRVQLYRKLKSITGQSPNELLRLARLKKASELLKSGGDMNISEIAFAVGFSSSSYFTKCYKDYFGETPAESLKRASKAGE